MNAVPDTIYATGFWLLEQERAQDAIHVFRTMLSIAPADERGWLALGECHERLGTPIKASRLYALGTAACGPTVRLLLAGARVGRKLGHDDQATDAYDRAWELAVEQHEDDFVRIIEIERRAA